MMIKSIQGLRALAMLGIFLFHSGLLLNGTFPVTFFFILSGFVLYYSRFDKVDMSFNEWLVWIFNKMKPLYIIHLVTFLLSIIIRWEWLTRLTVPQIIKRIVLDLFLIQSLFENDAFIFNGLAWYLSITFILYLIAIPLIRIIKKIPSEKLIIAIVLLLIIEYTLNVINISNMASVYLYSNPFYRVLDFTLGMLVSRMFIEKRFSIIKYNFYEIVIVSIFLVMYLLSFIIQTGCSYYSLLFIIALYVFAFGKGTISSILENSLLQSIAKISFEFYMIHELILIVFRRVFKGLNYHWLIKNIIICIPAFVVSLILAILMNKYITINLKKKTIIPNSRVIKRNLISIRK